MADFIKTFDYNTMLELKKQGFTMISPDDSKVWVFLINKPMNFSEDFKKKIVLTNVIAV